MCELLGFSAREPADISEQLRAFYAHSSAHPHGWGIMYDGGIEREAVKASESERLKGLLDKIGEQRVLLAHIRYATVGSIRNENCHPFTKKDITGRQWTLIHNGTIYSSTRLIPYLRTQIGDTDSERVFMYLLDTLNKAQENGPLSAEDRFALVDRFVRELAPRNKLNLLIYDGELLYVHKNMKETMVYRKLGSGYIFATTELDDEHWDKVPTAQVLAFKDGEQVFSGDKHDGIYVETLQYINPMDAMNI